jgi:hypothetical protein
MVKFNFKMSGIVMGSAAILTLGAMVVSPVGLVSADKMGKVSVCHFQEQVLDSESGEVIENAEWKVININVNALPAHLGNDQHEGHRDGQFMDQLIDESEMPAEGTVSSSPCLARNSTSGT